MKRIINCETGEVIERELTEEEIAQQSKDEAEFTKLEKIRLEQIAARQAILDRLGLTEEEAKLLLG